MRCKDMKAEIKRLEKQNRDLRLENRALQGMEGRCYPFNYLDIMVRPKRNARLIHYDVIDTSLSVTGDFDKVPTMVATKRVSLTAIDIIRGDQDAFTQRLGEVLAAELAAAVLGGKA